MTSQKESYSLVEAVGIMLDSYFDCSDELFSDENAVD